MLHVSLQSCLVIWKKVFVHGIYRNYGRVRTISAGAMTRSRIIRPLLLVSGVKILGQAQRGRAWLVVSLSSHKQLIYRHYTVKLYQVQLKKR